MVADNSTDINTSKAIRSFNTEKVEVKRLNFLPVTKRGDTGAENYYQIYKKYRLESLKMCKHQYIPINTENYHGSMDIFDDVWLHIRNGLIGKMIDSI